MSDVDKRLEDIFKTEDIVFWYDHEGKLQEEFESLELDVKKIQIDNNQFTIKYEILNAQENSKFLIYSSTNKPEDKENWLLDLELKSYIFSADRSSIILNDLGIDMVYKPFIDNHIEFFKNKTRTEAFKKLLEKNDDEYTLAFKMIASVLKCDPTIERIAIQLMYEEDSYTNICKYNLESYLWVQIRSKFKYDVEEPTFKDFGYKLLQNHFYSYIDRSKCELNNEAVLFVKNWMDSSSNKESFETLSKKVQDDLSIVSTLDQIKYEKIVECDTFEACEQMIISQLSKIIQEESKTAQQILDICSAREHTFWYSNYINIYKAFKSAIKLMDMVKTNNFSISNFDSGIQEYAREYSKVDYYYRKYVNHFNQREHSQILKDLDKKVENIYINDYLRVLNDNWQTNIDSYKTSSLTYQKNFFNNYVQPIVESNQKAFVIISDAMRYECGVELKNQILGLNRYTADIEPLIGVLPSFTQLGIASLLPNESLEFKGKDDVVYVDGKSSKGTANRNKILKDSNPEAVYIDSESFLDLKRDDGREFTKSHQIIYIYHNEIDSTGDKASSEHKVFDSVEDSFKTIEKIIKQIANFNGTNILITSDHGFLYQDTPTADSEFCSVEKPDDAKRFNRRFIIADNINQTDCIDLFDASDLNIDGSDKIAMAKSINKIRLQGGGNRFVHGGATLQEMVVPLISIKKKRKDDVRDVAVSITPISRITTNTVMISFYQEEVISDKVKPLSLKIALFSKDDRLISNYQSFTFDSEDTHDRNRETKLKFDLKQNAGDYSGQYIKLVMKKIIDGSNEEPIYKESNIQLQISFVNDFDEF